MPQEILVFGSLNADLVFPVETLPKRGETVICPGYSVFPGGKGANQAVAAARAGATVHMAGRIGRDGFGDLLIQSLEGNGVQTSSVRRVDNPTGCAAIGVDRQGENQIMVAGGANLGARASDVDDGRLTPKTILVLQMEVTPDENWLLINRAHTRGVRIVLNVAPAAPVPADILAMTDILVVNEVEALTVAQCGSDEVPRDSIAAGRAIAERARLTCVITLGAEGTFACGPDGSWRVDALPINAVDTTAAGDCFVGWLAARLTTGDALPAALRWASVAAGLACLSTGAQPSLPPYDTVAARFAELAEATPA